MTDSETIRDIKAVERFMGNLPRFEDSETLQSDEGYLILKSYYHSWNGVMPVYHKLRLHFISNGSKVPQNIEFTMLELALPEMVFNSLAKEIIMLTEL